MIVFITMNITISTIAIVTLSLLLSPDWHNYAYKTKCITAFVYMVTPILIGKKFEFRLCYWYEPFSPCSSPQLTSLSHLKCEAHSASSHYITCSY